MLDDESPKKAAKKSAKAGDKAGPGLAEGKEISPEAARLAFDPAREQRHERVRAAMSRLYAAPPQVLLLEGGLDHERLSMALWYAAALNCQAGKAEYGPERGPEREPEREPERGPERGPDSGADTVRPCLACPSCLQIGADVHKDLHIIDGRDSSIKIDTVRELRALCGEAPRGGGTRVIVLAEAQALSVQAANGLLKCLEEPRPGTVFLLLAPQRERLLPTLVSRGWTLTLAWPDVAGMPEHMRQWEDMLVTFLRKGQGLFEHTGVKGAVDAHSARLIVLCLQKALAALASGRGGQLADCIEHLSPQARFAMADILTNAQESLDLMVNPALVVDAMMTRLFVITKTGQARI